MKRFYPVFFVLWLFGSAFATTYPITLTDELGREVTLLSEPMRIVSMLPSDTETLCAVNACDKLVGVDTFSTYPEQVAALPQLGGGLTGVDGGPDTEAIVALQPDLVLVSEYGELAQLLSDAGLTVYAGSPQTVQDTLTFFGIVGQMVNREAQAALLSGRVQGEIEAVAELTSALPVSSVYYEIDPTPYSIGPDSFIGTLLAKAGGETISPAELGDFPQLDPEFVIATDPQIIILGDAPGESATTLAARPGWATLSALETGRVFELSDAQGEFVNRPGPRMGDTVKLFASFLHPGLF
ncbi:ABC transporter substrate-binding protein [soil metagenome]